MDSAANEPNRLKSIAAGIKNRPILGAKCRSRVSSLLVVWGVILESREIILRRITKGKNNPLSDAIHHEIELYGISLVALGLIVEVTDYVNNQFQGDDFNYLALEMTALVQWVVLFVVLLDTCGLSLRIISGLWQQREHNC